MPEAGGTAGRAVQNRSAGQRQPKDQGVVEAKWVLLSSLTSVAVLCAVAYQMP